MEHSKIIEFYQEYESKEFPFFETQGADKCIDFRMRLANNLEIGYSEDNKVFSRNLINGLQYYKTTPYDFRRNRLSELFNNIGIVNLPSEVYINWYNFDLIDQMKFKDLETYLLDLWYPQEDIEIFPFQCDWIISLNHDSIVKFHKALQET